MTDQLKDKSVAFLLSNGFAEQEYLEVRNALMQSGATTNIISDQPELVKGFNYSCNCNLVDPECWGRFYDVDENIKDAEVVDFDALFIPGGILSIYHMRANEPVMNFIHRFYNDRKIIACSSNGMYLLNEAIDLRGLLLTSDRRIKYDLVNAGAIWLDKPLVEDRKLITCRSVEDLDIMKKQFVNILSGIKHTSHKQKAKTARVITS